MHDKVNDEETKNQVNNDINMYFDLSTIGLEDLDKKITEVTFDSQDSKEE